MRSEISTPNFCNSPWIRGAPQSGFALVIFATSVRKATSVDGRPRRDGRERAAHRRRNHWRCQRTNGVGLDEDQGLAPVPPRVGEEDPEESVRRSQLWTSAGAFQRGQLLAKRQVLKGDGSVPDTNQADGSEEKHDGRQHARSSRGSSARFNRPGQPFKLWRTTT